MFGFGKPRQIPAPGDALPGREDEMDVAKTHFVNGAMAPFTKCVLATSISSSRPGSASPGAGICRGFPNPNMIPPDV